MSDRMVFRIDWIGYTTEDKLAAHDRQTCLVLGKTDDVDTADTRSGMYLVRFDDGYEAAVYPDELVERRSVRHASA